MDLDKVLQASKELAPSITECLTGVQKHNPDLAPIYAVCLTVTDDFSQLMLYANTTAHFSDSGGSMLNKWYFAEWWSEGMDIEADPLLDTIGEVEDSDETPENDLGPFWLAAMTKAMQIAAQEDSFVSNGGKPFLFCSMIDSSNATWLESLSAQFLNPPASFNSIEPELKAAQKDWYGSAQGNDKFKAALEKILQQL